MLGPVSGVASAARRRSRRRRRLILLVTVILVFVVAELVHQVVNASSPSARRTAGTWIADVSPVVTETNTLTPTFAYVVSKGSTMTRPQLVLTMQSLVDSSAGEVSELRANTFAPPSPGEQQRLLRAMSLRASAFFDLNRAVDGAISGQSTAVVGSQFQDASAAMRSANVAFKSFYHLLPRGSDPSQLPTASWTSPKTLWSSVSLQNLATRLSQANQLRPHPHITIAAISLSPLPEVVPTTTTSTTTTTTVAKNRNPTTTSSTISSSKKTVRNTTTTSTTTTTFPKVSQIPTGSTPSVFAPTASIRPIVVIRNDGNVTETNVTIQAIMNGEIVKSAPLGSLAPGSSRFVELVSLAVRTKQMSSCASASLRHDRCTSLEVRLNIGGQIQTQRTIALAFFVS
jgi:hypothetical protein